MLWVKSFHILFVAAWFAGLFYLPRIFVNLAMETNETATVRLNLMAHKLYRFMSLLAIPAVLSGAALWLHYGVGKGPSNGWMHAKLFVIILILGYHHGCGRLLKKFAAGKNKRSHIFYRWFNEVPVLLMTVAIILVVVKPF